MNPTTSQPILCAVDAGPRARAAASLAARAASTLERPLILLNAMPATPPLMALASVRSTPMDHSERSEAARLRSRALLDELASEADVDALDLEVASGLPADVVLERAGRDSAALIVMGTHNRGLLASAVLGSVSAAVVGRAEQPVILVPHDVLPAWTPQTPIIAALDESSLAEASLEAAARIARRAGVPLVAVHVTAPPAPAVAPAMVGGVPLSMRPVEAGAATAARVRQLRQAAELTGAEFVVREGDVATEVLLVAEERRAAMIAVGTHGLGRVRTTLLGSVTRDLLDSGTLPLLVVTERSAGAVDAL